MFHNGEKVFDSSSDPAEEMEKAKNKKGLTFSSQFDSGNMRNCSQGDTPKQYNIWISADSLPYDPKGHYKTWFYFSVAGVEPWQELTFSVRNMSN